MRPIENKIPLFYITIFFCSSFSLLKFFIHSFLLDILTKKEWIICKILYISKFYFYFSSFLFSLSFSALYYILQKMYQIAFLFINYCSRIVVIEEGAFLRHLLKFSFSYIFTETKIDIMNMHIELMNNKLLYS